MFHLSSLVLSQRLNHVDKMQTHISRLMLDRMGEVEPDLSNVPVQHFRGVGGGEE